MARARTNPETAPTAPETTDGSPSDALPPTDPTVLRRELDDAFGQVARVDDALRSLLGEIAALRAEVADQRAELERLRQRDVEADVAAVRNTFELDHRRVVVWVPRQLAPGESPDADRPMVPAIVASLTAGPEHVTATVATFDPRDGLRFREVSAAELV